MIMFVIAEGISTVLETALVLPNCGALNAVDSAPKKKDLPKKSEIKKPVLNA